MIHRTSCFFVILRLLFYFSLVAQNRYTEARKTRTDSERNVGLHSRFGSYIDIAFYRNTKFAMALSPSNLV